MQGSKLLKITGIIMTVLGAISILANIYLIIGQSKTNLILLSVSLIASVLYLLLGILGIKNFNKPEQAKNCIIACFIYIAILLISHIFSSIVTTPPPIIWAVYSIDYIIPVLYLIAAFQLKKMGKQ